MRKVFASLGIAAGAFLLAAGVSAADTKLTIQIGSPAPDIAYSDIFVAEQRGYFKEEGLEVETRLSSGGPLAIQIASSGGADLAATTLEPYLAGYESGIRGKFIFNKYHELIYYIAVPEDSKITSVADLKGKNIGVTNMASVAVVIAKSILRHASIDPVVEMFTPVGLGNSAIVALKNDQVQALAMWSSAFASLEQNGLRLRYFHHPVAGDIGDGGYFAPAKTLEEKPEAIVGFLRAIVRAHVDIRKDPDVAINAFWTAYPAGKVGDMPELQHENAMRQLKTMGIYFGDTPADQIGTFDLEKIQRYLGILKEEGLTMSDLKADDVVTNEFLAKAAAK
ncbi:MAG: ABC transporter substrate-binding protein [Rhizobiaceae bacterium]|nr:ABC transporter substrate-binding protein [Rhizobiaceae bacterium]